MRERTQLETSLAEIHGLESGLADNLVESRVDKISEFDLSNGTQPIHRRTQRYASNQR